MSKSLAKKKINIYKKKILILKAVSLIFWNFLYKL